MSRLRELVDELCPDGVKYMQVGNCITSLRTGLNPRKNFVLNTEDATNYYITVRELDGINVVPSEKTDLVNDKALQLIDNRSHLMAGDILFSGVGTVGRTAFVEDKPINWNIKEGVYAITVDVSVVNSKYMFWFLRSTVARSQFMRGTDGGTVSSLSMASFKNLRIPVPPIEVQREIVRILDSFQELDDVLTAEIDAREKQYKTLRDSLLFRGSPITKRPFKEFCESMNTGPFGSSVHKADYVDDGCPIVNPADIVGTRITAGKRVSAEAEARLLRYKLHKDDIVIGRRGEMGRIGLVDDDSEGYLCGTGCFFMRMNDEALPGFWSHFFGTAYAKQYLEAHAVGGTMKNLNLGILGDMPVPVPERTEQTDIVTRLDAACSLINLIYSERDARRKQFGHYRDRLLTFPEKVAS